MHGTRGIEDLQRSVELREFEDSLCFSSDVKEEAPLVSGEMKVGSMGQYE